MKRYAGCHFALAMIICLSGYGPAVAAKPKPPPDYYPLKVGSKWNYKVEVMGKVLKGCNHLAKIENIDGVKMARIEFSMNGQIAATEHLSASDKGVFRHRLNGIEINPPLALIKIPAATGAVWKQETKIGKEKISVTCSAGAEEINVPAGKFKTLTVVVETTVMDKKFVSTYWFAPGVGVVKQTFNLAGTEGSLELESFESVN